MNGCKGGWEKVSQEEGRACAKVLKQHSHFVDELGNLLFLKERGRRYTTN